MAPDSSEVPAPAPHSLPPAAPADAAESPGPGCGKIGQYLVHRGPGQMCKSEYPNILQESRRETLGIIRVMENQGQRWTGQPSSPHGPRPTACAAGGSPSGSHAAWLSALGQPPAVPLAGPSRPPGPRKGPAPPGGKARRILGEMKSLCSEPGSSRFLLLGQLHTLPLSLPPIATLFKVSPGTPRRSLPRP